MKLTSYDRIYAVVRRIPRGRVATYGGVATLAGLRGQARLVGYAMSALRPGTTVPWHRVVNAKGRISLRRPSSDGALTQRVLLERERVIFDSAGRIALGRFEWKPQRRRRP
jgi:methylated-DNA-protein-cysteine methyltransferase-like protein